MPHHNSHYYEFGPYRLDVGQRVLTRTGEAVSLTPKATEILTLLVVNAGQLVGKDELLKQVWPDTFVEESNLTQNIFLLRRILGDERPAPRYIETVVRRGYRFIANVRVVGGGNGDSPESRDTGALRLPHEPAGDGEDASAPPTVAVLPFLNATGNDDLEYLADGLTDNLVNNLSRVRKLRVMSRSAVFRYKTKKFLDPRGVGRELGVGVVLVGKLTTTPSEGVSISVELVEVSSGWQLWGDGFDCQLKDILEVQDRITRQLLHALKLKLTGDEEKRVTARYTENAEAYQAYLEARFHWSKYTRRGIEKAIIHFRHAIELDPNYALAYEGIIDCYLRLVTNYLPPEKSLTKPERVSGARRRSRISNVEIKNETLPSIDDTDARVKVRFEWDWKVAERELHRAHELRSEYPTAHQWFAAYRLAKHFFELSSGSSDESEAGEKWKLPTQILSGEPSAAEQLQVLCAVARGQIAVCNYEAAKLILKPFYPLSDWPKLSSLTTPAAADLLFTLGILIASVATTQQTTNSYRRAAAFLNGSIALFEHLDLKSRSVEARAELARCYYRQGLFDIAREALSAALNEVPDDQLEIRCRCLIYAGMLERDAGRVEDAMQKLREAAVAMAPVGPLVSVRYHLEVAGALRELASCESQEEHNDEALFHYRASLYEAEAIGDHRTTATVENNFGLFLLNLNAWDEAEKHLLRSRKFFEVLSDKFRGAQVNETLTRLYLATSRYSLAESAIENSIETLESTDSEAVLCETLTTAGIVASRLGNHGVAKNRFEAAYKVAERCGDREGGRRALISLVEELKDYLDLQELRQVFSRLTRLYSVTEPSALVGRVENSIAQLTTIIKKNTASA
jgi:DNA-binding winged helix-turn-helix (wHTH) protein/tetratricopeptide (TPR) repeat protein